MSSALFVCAKLRLTFPFPLYSTPLFSHYSQDRCGIFPFPQFVHPCNCYFSRYLSLAFVAFYRVFQTGAQEKKPKSIESKNSRELEKLPKKSVWKKHIKKCAALCLRFLWFPLPTSAAKRLLLHLTLLQYLSPLLCGSVDASIALGEMCLVMRAWTQLDMARLLLLCFCLTDLHAFQLHTHDSALQPCREALTGCA